MWVFERFYGPDELSRLANQLRGVADYASSHGDTSESYVAVADDAAKRAADFPHGMWAVLLRSSGNRAHELRAFKRKAVRLQKGLGPGAYRFRNENIG